MKLVRSSDLLLDGLGLVRRKGHFISVRQQATKYTGTYSRVVVRPGSSLNVLLDRLGSRVVVGLGP
jgi:hypothetical protein